MSRRNPRPYEQKSASRGGALIFGMGFGALMASVVIVVGLTIPNISTKINNLPFYARTYYRKLIPHPEYLPKPATSDTAAVVVAQVQPESIKLELPPLPDPPLSDEVIQAAITLADNGDTSSEVATAITGDNLLQSKPVNNVVVQPADNQVELRGFNHQWQTWNNCGPATVTTTMSFYGRSETQADAAEFLKPNSDDKNVSPHELAAYARSTGMAAIVRQGGTVEQLKQFLSNNLPVLVETWLLHDGDGLGHYRLVSGYNDATGQFNTFDTLNGPNFKVDYNDFDSDWRVFNRLYVVIYQPGQADLVSKIIGPDMDDTSMYNRLLDQAQTEIDFNPEDAIAYFNQGEALTRLNRHSEAVIAFDRARNLGLHWRRLWYQFSPFEAYYVTGRYQDVLDLAEATITGTGGLEEAYYYQGLARHATGQPGADESFQAAISYNPNFTPAHDALNTLLTNP